MESSDRKLSVKILSQHFKSSHPSLVQDLQHVDEACRKIATFWDEYDYGSLEANGFRSFVKKCDMLFHNMKTLVERQNDPKLLQGYMCMVPAFVRQVSVLEIVRQKDADGHHDKTRFYFPEDNTMLHLLLTATNEEVRPMYTRPGAFWLHPIAAYFNTSLCYVILLTNASWSEKMKLVLNPSYFAHQVVKMIKDLNVQRIRDMFKVASLFPFNAIVAASRYVIGTTSRYADLPRKSKWQFHLGDTSSLLRIERTKRDSLSDKSKSVKCLILSSVAGDCQTLIFHVHGSGYISMTPSDHEAYLRYWSKKLTATVVAPDYAKAPENPFPSGLQDILDAYIQLTSSDVTGIIGFQPKKIVLTGDSAGGNMAMALLFALNEIKRRLGGDVIMPIGVCLQSPLTNAMSIPASGAQTCLDLFLPSTLTTTVATAYARTDPETESDWFQKEEGSTVQVIGETLARWATLIRDPYFNLMAYKDWEELEMPLQIQVGEFDGLLDNAIDMAKKWKGAVTLDVMEGMPHCFHSMPTARKEAELIVLRLKQMIYLNPDREA